MKQWIVSIFPKNMRRQWVFWLGFGISWLLIAVTIWWWYDIMARVALLIELGLTGVVAFGCALGLGVWLMCAVPFFASMPMSSWAYRVAKSGALGVGMTASVMALFLLLQAAMGGVYGFLGMGLLIVSVSYGWCMGQVWRLQGQK